MRSLGLALAALLVASPQSQDRPVFRATVDVVTVDVAVVDKDGAPLTHLAPADFTLVAGQRPRKVLTADYVTVATGRPKPTGIVPAPPSVPAPSTNSRPPTGRSFLFVVDLGHLTPSNGRAALQSISTFLDELDPEDRVGLVGAPYYTPRIDLTTNRRVIRDAVTRLNGAASRIDPTMPTVGEASAIEGLDPSALTDYLDRIRAGCNDNPPQFAGMLDAAAPSCLLKWSALAMKIMQAERQRTRELFDTLSALTRSMSAIDGPKSLILVSEGLVNDRETTDDLRRFAAASERARLTLYALNLTMPLSDNSGQLNMTTAHIRDQQVLLDGMATLAIAGRGDTFTISGTATRALARINAEMSGYYLLSFERDATDREGQRAGIDVKVNWPGAVVRARKDYTPVKGGRDDAAVAMPADLKAAVHDLIRWPVETTGLGIDVDTYSTPVVNIGQDVQTIVAASFATGGQPIAAAGFEVTDDTGKIVADGFEPHADGAGTTPVSNGVATERLTGDRQLYLAAVAIPPGAYRIKIAAIDATGRRGSLEHRFDVTSARLGALRMSDVFVGEIAASHFVPNPWLVPGAATLPVSVEVFGDAPQALDGASMTLELGRPGAPAFATMPLTMKASPEPRRRTAGATLSIASLPPGQYLVTAILRAADGGLLRRARAFTKR